jgi:replicative DNA helicase
LPRLSDLRESGALEQDADLIMFLARKENAPDTEMGTTDLVIGKHRNGPTGRLELVFNAEYTRFDNLASPARRERF